MAAKPPLISVVIPHLNQQKSLRRCLRSLMAQTCPRNLFEVVVVDNGSIEPPTEVTGAFDGVRLEHEPSRGPGPARNLGVAVSRGEILAFIDADCTAEKSWLAAIAERFESAREGLILGGDVGIAIEDPQRLTMLEAYECVFAYRQQEYIEKHGFSGTGNLAVRRRDFHAIGPFAGIDQAEDREWGRRARSIGYDIVYVPGMIVYHPARTAFDGLYEKWDRHVLHDFNDWRDAGRGKAAWVRLAGAVALSPVIHAGRILKSSRISGVRARLLAVAALVRIRFYRAGAMLRLVTGESPDAQATSWNRPSGSN